MPELSVFREAGDAMDENKGQKMKGSEKNTDSAAAQEIRVTDRRRIHLKNNGQDDSSGRSEAPSLKPTYVEELEARTKAAEQKVLDVQSRFEELRAQLQSETDETRQRLNRAADERAQRGTTEFIVTLLPVIDNLRRALQAAESSGCSEAIIEGVRGTASSLDNALAGAGVEPIEAVGQPFNPEFHEAVDTIKVEPEMDGRVTAEYARGYRIGDRLLRPARVQVGRAPEKAKKIAG